MPDPNMVFWAGIPDGAILEATAANQSSTGTFGVVGTFLEVPGNHQNIQQLPFRATLHADHGYHISFEVLPVGGAIVDAKVVVTHGGQEIRGTRWAPVRGAPGLRVVAARTEKQS